MSWETLMGKIRVRKKATLCVRKKFGKTCVLQKSQFSAKGAIPISVLENIFSTLIYSRVITKASHLLITTIFYNFNKHLKNHRKVC